MILQVGWNNNSKLEQAKKLSSFGLGPVSFHVNLKVEGRSCKSSWYYCSSGISVHTTCNYLYLIRMTNPFQSRPPSTHHGLCLPTPLNPRASSSTSQGQPQSLPPLQLPRLDNGNISTSTSPSTTGMRSEIEPGLGIENKNSDPSEMSGLQQSQGRNIERRQCPVCGLGEVYQCFLNGRQAVVMCVDVKVCWGLLFESVSFLFSPGGTGGRSLDCVYPFLCLLGYLLCTLVLYLWSQIMFKRMEIEGNGRRNTFLF